MSEKEQMEIRHMFNEIEKMNAETRKIRIEAGKLKREDFYYPFVVGAGVFGVAVAFVKLFLN